MRLLLAFLFCCTCCAASQAADSVRVKKTKPLRVWASFGGVFGVHSTDFFKGYKAYMGGPSSTFDVPYVVEGGIASYLWKNLSLGLSGSYYRAVMCEDYNMRLPVGDTAATLYAISQDMTVTSAPVLLTFDYYPTDRQFSTFVGGGLGLGFVSIVWKQGVYGGNVAEQRTNYDATHIVPAAMVRAGISLGWDKERATRVSGALSFEVRYTYMNVAAPLFKQVSGSIPNAGADTQGDYHIQAGGFGLHVGVTVIVN